MLWLKALIEWLTGAETKRIRAENARKEKELVAAACNPDAAPDLLEQATIYFSGKDTKSLKEMRNGSSKTGRAGVA